jgi:hypothetical protein
MRQSAQPGGRSIISLSVEERKALDAMAKDFGFLVIKDFIRYLTICHRDGLLVVMNKTGRECLVGAAEETMLRKAVRAAREETLFQLYNEGFRTSPYET